MGDELEMRKRSMSGGVKKLEEFDIVKEEFRRGRGKEDFMGEKEFLMFLGKFLSKKFEGEIEMNVEAVKDGEGIMNALVERSDLSEGEREEAEKIKGEVDDTDVY
ncbi:hypothetical protein [Staphylococcus aureus]|uniref:hypothetical protein n=1 Tax=Staphylococcus aureus TaxID=1280 RepID=UPI001C9303C3